MKSDGLELLEKLTMEAKRKQYPNIRLDCLPVNKFNDRTAGALTKSILAWLKIHNHKAWRQSSEGRYRPGKAWSMS